jgi:hypothetical protein
MYDDERTINLRDELEALAVDLNQGNPYASVHLARLIEADSKGAFRPFAEALAARLNDHLKRYAELGITDPEITLCDEVYRLLQITSLDWDRLPCNGRPGEEA